MDITTRSRYERSGKAGTGSMLAPDDRAVASQIPNCLGFFGTGGQDTARGIKATGHFPVWSKSRVQRGRSLLMGMMFECCQFEFDHQGKVIDYHTKNNDCDSC